MCPLHEVLGHLCRQTLIGHLHAELGHHHRHAVALLQRGNLRGSRLVQGLPGLCIVVRLRIVRQGDHVHLAARRLQLVEPPLIVLIGMIQVRHHPGIGIDRFGRLVTRHVQLGKMFPSVLQVTLVVPELPGRVHHAVARFVAHLHPGHGHAGLLDGGEHRAHVVSHLRPQLLLREALPVERHVLP